MIAGFFIVKEKMKEITWQEFEKVELRVGTIIVAEDFPEARKPAYKLKVDFGEEIGIRKSSAQITDHYTRKELIGKQIIGIVNFPSKQIGPFISECLVTGFYDEKSHVVLAIPDKEIENGVKMG
ncbi:MAG: tRNA-binding protein [Balneolaceae bacterium]